MSVLLVTGLLCVVFLLGAAYLNRRDDWND